MVPQTFEQNISYSIISFKDAMNYILEKFNTTFIDQNNNEVFNTYSFGQVKCLYNVALSKVDENTTNVKIVCSPTVTGSNEYDESNNGRTMIWINEFLDILTKKLEGKDDTEISTAVKNTNSTHSSLVSVITIIGGLVTLLIRLGIIYLLTVMN